MTGSFVLPWCRHCTHTTLPFIFLFVGAKFCKRLQNSSTPLTFTSRLFLSQTSPASFTSSSKFKDGGHSCTPQVHLQTSTTLIVCNPFDEWSIPRIVTQCFALVTVPFPNSRMCLTLSCYRTFPALTLTSSCRVHPN